MRLNKRQKSVFMLLCIILSLSFVYGNSNQEYQILLRDDDGVVEKRISLGEEDYFDVVFRHSVNRGLIIERYTFDREGQKISLTSAWFENYGAGMMDAIEEGMSMVEDGNMLRIDFPDWPLSSITYRSGGIANHKFIYEDQTIDFFEEWPYKAVTIGLEKKGFFWK